jgi:hypothetical protein
MGGKIKSKLQDAKLILDLIGQNRWGKKSKSKSQHFGALEGAAAYGLVVLLVEADGVVDGGSGRRSWFLGAAGQDGWVAGHRATMACGAGR